MFLLRVQGLRLLRDPVQFRHPGRHHRRAAAAHAVFALRAGGSRSASLVLLAVIGLSPVGNALIVPLEERFPPWDHGRGAPHGIVVLGGALSPDVSHARDDGGAQRGGRTPDRGGRAGAPLSRRAHHLFRRLGRGDFRRSGRRRNSRCGCWRASASRAAASSPRTSRATRSRTRVFSRDWRSRSRASAGCWSPPPITCRASIGIFRKAGFPVEAYPVDWRTRGTGDALRPFPTMGEGLRRTDTAMREWVGLVRPIG